MYEDFEDLRDNCPSRIKADIAMDIEHSNPARLSAIWIATGDDEFRLHLNQTVSDFWEKEVRTRGGADVPEDGFAIEIVIDSFTDQEMGSTLYLDLQAYCGTEAIGELAWKIFEDDTLERRFAKEMAAKVPELLGAVTSTAGMICDVEVTEVEEL
jgi:hypothetical protein